MSRHLGLVVIVDVKDGVAHSSILGFRSVEVVWDEVIPLFLQGNVFKHCVFRDCPVDIRLCLLREVDSLSVASACE